jgi:hypothetical protein
MAWWIFAMFISHGNDSYIDVVSMLKTSLHRQLVRNCYRRWMKVYEDKCIEDNTLYSQLKKIINKIYREYNVCLWNWSISFIIIYMKISNIQIYFQIHYLSGHINYLAFR